MAQDPVYLSPFEHIIAFHFADDVFAFLNYVQIPSFKRLTVTCPRAGTPLTPVVVSNASPYNGLPDSILNVRFTPGRFPFSRDRRSWIGRNVANTDTNTVRYVKDGALIGSFPYTFVRGSQIAPDGAGALVSHDAGVAGSAFIQGLIETERAVDILKVNGAGTGVDATEFMWHEEVEPYLADVGLSAWYRNDITVPGEYESTYFEMTAEGHTLQWRIASQVDHIGVDALAVMYGYVVSAVYVGDGLFNVVLASRLLVLAVDSKFVTRQSEGPNPGEVRVIHDETFQATATGKSPSFTDGFSSVDEGEASWYDTVNPFSDVSSFITPRGSSILATVHQVQRSGAGNSNRHVSRLFVDGTLVYSLPEGESSQISLGKFVHTESAGLRFIFTSFDGGVGGPPDDTIRLYVNGVITTIGPLDPSGSGEGGWNYTMTEDGQYLITYPSFFGAGDITFTRIDTGETASLPAGQVTPDKTDPGIFFVSIAAPPSMTSYRVSYSAGVISFTEEGGAISSPASTFEYEGETYQAFTSLIPFSTIPDYV